MAEKQGCGKATAIPFPYWQLSNNLPSGCLWGCVCKSQHIRRCQRVLTPLEHGASGAHRACTFPLPSAERSCPGAALAPACVGQEPWLPTTSPGPGCWSHNRTSSTAHWDLESWGISSSSALNRAPSSLLTDPGSLCCSAHHFGARVALQNFAPEPFVLSKLPRAFLSASGQQAWPSLSRQPPHHMDSGHNARGAGAAAPSSLDRARSTPGPRARSTSPAGLPSAQMSRKCRAQWLQDTLGSVTGINLSRGVRQLAFIGARVTSKKASSLLILHGNLSYRPGLLSMLRSNF